jgi:hypothetical protein
MFCPQCGAEYRQGFERCSDCRVALVRKAPVKKPGEPLDFVTVLETGDRSILLVAKSRLEAAGIEFFAKGEGVQDLFAAGRIGTHFNPLTGPVQLQVEHARAEEARELLAEIDPTDLVEE